LQAGNGTATALNINRCGGRQFGAIAGGQHIAQAIEVKAVLTDGDASVVTGKTDPRYRAKGREIVKVTVIIDVALGGKTGGIDLQPITTVAVVVHGALLGKTEGGNNLITESKFGKALAIKKSRSDYDRKNPQQHDDGD